MRGCFEVPNALLAKINVPNLQPLSLMPSDALQTETGAAITALSEDEFAKILHNVGMFESNPDVAVGCSGGADSLALTLLLANWVARRNGHLTALIVDHGLRSGSADEANQVKNWLAERSVDCEVLCANLLPETSSLQEAARLARYDLMGEWCVRQGVLHLFIAHHGEDQAETLLMNLVRGSGVDGLAGMATISERPQFRVLRPLLGISKARLERTLGECGQKFIEDPSNKNRKFKRVRIREVLPVLAREGATVGRLIMTAHRMSNARKVLEDTSIRLLAGAAEIYPEGYARLDFARWSAAPAEISRRSLGRVVMCVGGKLYPPRSERLMRCYVALTTRSKTPIARTLGGCRVIKRGPSIYICCEVLRIPESVTVLPNQRWNGRFLVSNLGAKESVKVRSLGAKSVKFLQGYRAAKIPATVRHALPTILGLDGEAFVPQLIGVTMQDGVADRGAVRAVFQPLRPLSGAPFGVENATNSP